MTVELCRHEMPTDRCDICTPREPKTRKSGAIRIKVGKSSVENADTVIVAAANGYSEYIQFSAYTCQDGRSFRDEARWMGFYAKEGIQREIPEILYVRDHVTLSPETVEKWRTSGDEVDGQFAKVIEKLVSSGGHSPEEVHKIMLLTTPSDPRTFTLERAIQNDLLDHKGTGTAFTQHQRYTRLDALRRNPRTTSELAGLGVSPDEGRDEIVTFHDDDIAYEDWVSVNPGYVLTERKSGGYMTHDSSCSHLGRESDNVRVTERPRRWARDKRHLTEWATAFGGSSPSECQDCV